jgi:outer membrane protein assembly factor BamE (lipoprotein component of BamABCDE complex)
MGQPSFENFFEKNVWNYIYKITTGDEVDVEKKVRLVFDSQNLLSEVVVLKI